MLSDPTAPVVTLSLEDQTLAPAFPLVRLPYLEKLLEVVKHGHAPEQYREKLASAVKQAHSDLASYLAYLIVHLFMRERLEKLQHHWRCFAP